MAGDTPSAGNNRSYSVCRWTTFIGMYVGYTLAVFNRKCFSFALPAIMKSLQLSKNEVGLISSCQNLAYTISKFCGGILSDSISAKQLFAFGLLMSGLLTLSLTVFQSGLAFAVILFLQGLCQGGGWPACAKILKQWFSPTEFGTWYSILNTTMNLACSLGPILTAFIIVTISWQASITTYGIASVLVSFVCFFCIWNSPTDIGHPSCSEAESKKDDSSRPKGRGTWQDMLHSPFMWVICICYLIVFMGRTATLDWAQLYIIQELGHNPYIGSIFISSLEVGGIIGSISAGYLADKLVIMSRRDSIQGSPRMTVATLYIALYIAGTHSLTFLISSGTSEVWFLIVGFVMGFGIYGPVSLYGIMAIEAAPTHLSGTSHAIVSLAAYIGAVVAGLPFSLVAKYLDWKGAFVVLEVLLIGVLIIMVVTRNFEYKMVPTKKKLQ